MKFARIVLTSTFWATLLLLLTQCGSNIPSALAPDMVLFNGKIVTVDEDFSIAQAIAIKDGLLVAVGTDQAVLALAGVETERMDLEGKTVLPGFNDSHLHLSWPVGEPPDPAIQQLGKARSIEEIVEVVRQKVAVTPPGELVWMPGGVSRVEQIEEKRWPTRHDLDPVSPENPVIVIFSADHVYVTNSLGLSKAGINRRSVQPCPETGGEPRPRPDGPCIDRVRPRDLCCRNAFPRTWHG